MLPNGKIIIYNNELYYYSNNIMNKITKIDYNLVVVKTSIKTPFNNTITAQQKNTLYNGVNLTLYNFTGLIPIIINITEFVSNTNVSLTSSVTSGNLETICSLSSSPVTLFQKGSNWLDIKSSAQATYNFKSSINPIIHIELLNTAYIVDYSYNQNYAIATNGLNIVFKLQCEHNVNSPVTVSYNGTVSMNLYALCMQAITS